MEFPRRIGLGLLFLTALGACGDEPYAAGPGATAGNSSQPTSADLPSAAVTDLPGANRVQPDPKAVKLQPFAWATALPVSGKNQVRVLFTTDGSDCQVLGKATTAETAQTITITLMVGELPGVDCSGPRPAIAFPAEVIVDVQGPVAGRKILRAKS